MPAPSPDFASYVTSTKMTHDDSPHLDISWHWVISEQQQMKPMGREELWGTIRGSG